MNFIATVEYKSAITDPINIYGLEYSGADVAVPGTGSNAEVRFRALCYNREGAKLTAFKEWKQGNRALITGTIMFTDDPCLLYTSPSPRDRQKSRMPSSA